MKTKLQIVLVVGMIAAGVLSCNLPWDEPTSDAEFPPTPNETMTALFAQATVLTPDLSGEKDISPTPSAILISPTLTDTLEATASLTPTLTITPTLEESLTFTPPPTLTGAPIPNRASGYFVASFLSSPPTIDGDWSDWGTIQYPAGFVVFGLGSWTDQSDLEGAFRIGWDATNLYIAVKVNDDIYVQNATDQDIWKGDSVEILLDVDLYNDFYSTSLGADDYQLGISPGKPDTNGTKEAFLWFPSSISGSRSQVTVAAIGGSGTYRVEASIPWSVFGVTPYAGRHFGFALSISDNDNISQNGQDSMASCISTRKLTNPTTWGELVLGN
jgi:hypothetical protein